MSEPLRIEFEWLEGSTGSDQARAFQAALGIAMEGEYLTRLDDRAARTTRNRMRGCAYRLAVWLASGWWRLRWEPAQPGGPPDSAWLQGHCVAGVGGGFVWPEITFASDGDFVEIAMRPAAASPAWEPIRYLSREHGRVSAAAFEATVDRFVEAVLGRIETLGLRDLELPALWAEVCAERAGPPELRNQRRLEALAGFDPDEAPADFLQALLTDSAEFGTAAIDEIAAAARGCTPVVMEPVRRLARHGSVPGPGGTRVSLPALTPASEARPMAPPGAAPWEKGVALARLSRDSWGLGTAPVSDSQLAGLIEAPAAMFRDRTVAEAAIPFVLTPGACGESVLYLNKAHPTSRRFAVSRLIGDRLLLGNSERLAPATAARTARQQFQRAFAQEFLCPIEALRDFLGNAIPDEDTISEAAAFFDVSPLTVRTTLVNKGLLGRGALDWQN